MPVYVSRTRAPVHRSRLLNAWLFTRHADIAVLLGAANRDPEVFSDTDRLDVGRADGAHLSLGRGNHHCLGVPLARLEGRIVLEMLLERFGRMRLLDPRPRFHKTIVLRGLKSLLLRCESARAVAGARDPAAPSGARSSAGSARQFVVNPIPYGRRQARSDSANIPAPAPMACGLVPNARRRMRRFTFMPPVLEAVSTLPAACGGTDASMFRGVHRPLERAAAYAQPLGDSVAS